MSLQKVRNIGLAAHIDAGKTTVTERMLFFTGKTRKIGEVHDGQAVMDFMQQEKERGITIASAAISCNWKDHQINIIDTPGHIDFTIEVERCMRVIDGLVAVFCAVGGVEIQSEMVWGQADRYKVPRIAFINKMDRRGADFYECIKQLDEYLDAYPVPFEIPIGQGEDFKGTICPIDNIAVLYDGFDRVVTDVPGELREECKEARLKIIESLADFNDEILHLYLENMEVPNELLRKAARDATLKLLITPVFCGSAYTNKGIRLLLDGIIDYLPSPVDVGAVFGEDIENPEHVHKRDPSIHSPFCGLAFKLINDSYVGHQTFVRIYSGELKSGATVYNPGKRERERVNRILKIHAQEREDVDAAYPGDIVSLIGMKYTRTGDTLCDINKPLLLEKIFIPPSVVEQKISVQSPEDEAKLGKALRKLALEDPAFAYRIDKETDETIISGMGELHIDVIMNRIETEFDVKAIGGAPSVAFKETIMREATGETKLAKQTGGKGQYAHCVMRLEPNPVAGFEFVDHIRNGSIPKDYIPSIEKGIKNAMEEGVLANFPIVDVKVVLLDGSYHEVDSSDMAFQKCGSICFKDAFSKAAPTLLEPIMKFSINTPEEFVGDIINDVSIRRGSINSMVQIRGGAQTISCNIPLKETFGYANQLRNISSGRATYSMEFKEYAPLTEKLTQEVLEGL
ncbi:elongation factor G [bacterium]|nr:elongation factor G [bacterium]